MARVIRLTLAALALVGALGAAATALGQAVEPQVFIPLVVTAGEATAETPIQTGRATYYDATGDGNCMFGPTPGDLMVAAISHENYGSPDPANGPAAVWCGAYVEVTGELGTVVVRIVDKCPDALCTRNHLDLSPQAFAKVAPIAKGLVPITWRLVSPNLGRNVAYHIKPGSNPYWTAIQVRYHRNPLVKMEYLNGAGQWVTMQRQDYNYFVGEGMGPGPYTLRITDSYNNVLEDRGIPLTLNVELLGGGQFPVGP